jgi:predicted nucleic acid-binding protein
MGKRYLIDSNTLIDFQAKKLPANGQSFMSATIDEEFNISVISKIEVLGYPLVEQKTNDFVALANVFELDKNVADKTIELRRQYKIKLPDAIIAATALVSGLELVSHNISDFKNIAELNVIDLWNL